jgi:excisionase family DNA binding protein
MASDPAGEADLPRDAVIVLNPNSWRGKVSALGQLLAGPEGFPEAMRVIPDTSGRPPESTVMVGSPRYWSEHLPELEDALRSSEASDATRPVSRAHTSVGAISEAPTRLTWTVEEAAAALGISRAFAYDAVRRGQIPAIKIGRRILVPKSALKQLIENSGAAAMDTGDGGE